MSQHPGSNISPRKTAESLSNRVFFGTRADGDIFLQLSKELAAYGYDAALMDNLNIEEGIKHPHAREPSPNKMNTIMIRIYCARCTTHCRYHLADCKTSKEKKSNFRCAVIGKLYARYLTPEEIAAGEHPPNTIEAKLTYLFPHPVECQVNDPQHMLKHRMSSFESGSGFTKLPIKREVVIGPILNDVLGKVRQFTKGDFIGQENTEKGKLIDSFADNERRQMIRLDDVESPDDEQKSINETYGLDDPVFQREFQKLMIRLTLLVANHLNIADECMFETTHSSENVVCPTKTCAKKDGEVCSEEESEVCSEEESNVHPTKKCPKKECTLHPKEECNLHPTKTRHLEKHLRMKKAAVIAGGWKNPVPGMETLNQAPHTDFPPTPDGFNVSNNPHLEERCKPMSMIIPLDDCRKIVMYQEFEGEIKEKEVEVKAGEMIIFDSGCTHGGFTYEDSSPLDEVIPVFPALHIYIYSDLHHCDIQDLTVSAYHIMHYEKMAGYIINVSQENRLEEARTIAANLLRILPYILDDEGDLPMIPNALQNHLKQFIEWANAKKSS